MATTTLKTIIQLRRDTEANYELIKDSYIPYKGEVALVDTTSKGLRAKVGDGTSTYAQLGFTDEPIYTSIDNKVIRGYYLNGKFYTDSTYITECVKLVNTIYIDAITNKIYTYNGSEYVCVNDTLPTATDSIPGIMKLYGVSGQNQDGTMTQKVITDGVNSIQFALDTEEEECLILDLPWD